MKKLIFICLVLLFNNFVLAQNADKYEEECQRPKKPNGILAKNVGCLRNGFSLI